MTCNLWHPMGLCHYHTLQHTTTHCNTLSSPPCNRSFSTATHILQHTTTHCNTLPHTATYCRRHPVIAYSLLQHTYCNTLPHTATHYHTLHCNTLSSPLCNRSLSFSTTHSMFPISLSRSLLLYVYPTLYCYPAIGNNTQFVPNLSLSLILRYVYPTLYFYPTNGTNTWFVPKLSLSRSRSLSL